MWSISCLKFNDVHIRKTFTKDFICLDLLQKFLAFYHKYATNHIWAILLRLIRFQMVLFFFAAYIRGHGDEESWLSFFLNNVHCILVPLVIPSVRACVRCWQYIDSPTLVHLMAPVSFLHTTAPICLNLPLVVADEIQFASFFLCPVISSHLVIQVSSQM